MTFNSMEHCFKALELLGEARQEMLMVENELVATLSEEVEMISNNVIQEIMKRYLKGIKE